MEKDLISVIVPVYKITGSIVMKCLKSLQEQSYTKLEIIVVDDGTPNRNYDDIAASFSSDSRFFFYRKENGGLSDARNYGLDRANGEYIAFVDSDDFVESNYLSELYKAIQDADLAICGACETEYWMRSVWVDHRYFFSMPTDFNSVAFVNFCWNRLYRAKTFHEHDLRFPVAKGMIGEDALFHALYFPHCKNVRCIEGRYYHYVPNPNSITHTYSRDFWKWEYQIIDAQWKMFHTYPLSPRQEKHMLFWLYFKLKDVLNYYLNQEKDPQILKQKLREIVANPYFSVLKPLLKAEDPWWKKKDLKILRLWMNFGAGGILFFHRAKKIIKLGK